jgi:hypothetical protein
LVVKIEKYSTHITYLILLYEIANCLNENFCTNFANIPVDILPPNTPTDEVSSQVFRVSVATDDVKKKSKEA